MLTAVRSDSRHSPTVHSRTLSRALHELRAAVGEIAADEMHRGAAVARTLVEMLNELDESASAQQLLLLFIVVDRARNDARKARPPARYDWRAWGDVSRLAGDCVVAALRAMRNDMDGCSARPARITPDVAAVRGGPR